MHATFEQIVTFRMNLQQRKALLVRLGNYMSGHDAAWMEAREKATAANPWFTQDFINLAVTNISNNFLQTEKLQWLADNYVLPQENHFPKQVGIVMAGNIPLVGFHDLLCVFLTGHLSRVKLSSKDTVLLTHLVEVMIQWDEGVVKLITLCERIPDCDAYIATGSNHSARYFEYYFKKYPSIIRKNKTSVAVLTGAESLSELENLADDVFQYFGLGCRNVTKIYVPENYDFIPLLGAFKKYEYLADHNKYKNNYDYNLAVHILNNQFYMSTASIILLKDDSYFSRISQLHYEFFREEKALLESLQKQEEIQCIIGRHAISFGAAQRPGIMDFADGIDTVRFLQEL